MLSHALPFSPNSVENHCCLTPPLTITGLFPAPGAPGTLSEPCGHPGPQSQRGSLAQRTKASENPSWQSCSPDVPWELGALDPQHPFPIPLSLIIRGTAGSFFSRLSGPLNYSVRCEGGFPDWEVCRPHRNLHGCLRLMKIHSLAPQPTKADFQKSVTFSQVDQGVCKCLSKGRTFHM